MLKYCVEVPNCSYTICGPWSLRYDESTTARYSMIDVRTQSPDAEAALINPAQNDARRAANPSAVTTLYQLALAFRLLSWMFSCIVLGFAANTVAHAVTAEIKPLAGLLIALVGASPDPCPVRAYVLTVSSRVSTS